MSIDLAKVSKSPVSKKLLINSSIVVVGLILAIILGILFINPEIKAIRALKIKISDISNLNEREIINLTKEKSNLVKDKNKISNKIILAKNKLFNNKDISSVLDSFLLTAKKRKLEFTYIKPLSGKIEALIDGDVILNVRQMSIVLEMQAEFADFLGFLWEAEHSDQSFKIIELTIEKSAKKTLTQKERLVVNVYQLVPKEEDDKYQ